MPESPVDRLVTLVDSVVAGNDVDVAIALRHKDERLVLNAAQTTIRAVRLDNAGVPVGTPLTLTLNADDTAVFVPSVAGRWLVSVRTLAPITSYFEGIVNVTAPVAP